MSQVIDYLKRFNRKERFILLSHVLDRQTQESFRLNQEFVDKLEAELNLKIPGDAFVAMDYHLDWLQMALYLANEDQYQRKAIIRNPEESRLVRGNQEDIDLIVAFSNGEAHIVLIEAKADTSWNSDQLESKANRLTEIFGKKHGGVVPHLVLMSPLSKSQRDWPDWMRKKLDGRIPVHYLELPLRDGLVRVTRCDGAEKPDARGDYLLLSKRRGGQWLKRKRMTSNKRDKR